MTTAEQYVATEKTTEDGKVIFHKRSGGRGRPSRFVLEGDQYVALAKPKAVKKTVTVTPEATPVEA